MYTLYLWLRTSLPFTGRDESEYLAMMTNTDLVCPLQEGMNPEPYTGSALQDGLPFVRRDESAEQALHRKQLEVCPSQEGMNLSLPSSPVFLLRLPLAGGDCSNRMSSAITRGCLPLS